MTYSIRSLLLGSAMLAGPTAFAQGLDTPHTLDKVSITGSRSVPTDQLMAVLQEHKGDKVTQNDIVADRDAIMKVLGKANVGGSVKARMVLNPNTKRLTVEFIVNDEGVQAPVTKHVLPKLRMETFTGNASVASDTLTAAAALKPGQDLTNETIQAAQKAIVAAYAAAKVPVNVNVTGDINQTPDGKVDLTWKIVESKAKKKRRNTDDDGQKLGQ